MQIGGSGRRALGRAMMAGMLAAPGVVRAQAAQRVVALSWGGGVSATWREAFAQPYQQRSGVATVVRDAPDPTAQIRAQASAPQYNVFVGTYADAVNMHRDGLIETFDPAEIPAVAGTEPQYRLTTPEGRILGVPAYFTYYGIAANTDLVKPGEITSWHDLAEPRWRGKLAHARPAYGSIYDLTVFSYAAGGDERHIDGGLALYRGIAANAMTAFSSLAQANQLLSRGEIALAPYYASRVWAMKDDGLPVEMIIPRERALLLPYMAMVPKGTFDIRAAKGFLNLMLEPVPQQRTTELTGFLSLTTEARLSPELERRLGMPLAALKQRLIQPDWFLLAAEQGKRADMLSQLIATAR